MIIITISRPLSIAHAPPLLVHNACVRAHVKRVHTCKCKTYKNIATHSRLPTSVTATEGSTLSSRRRRRGMISQFLLETVIIRCYGHLFAERFVIFTAFCLNVPWGVVDGIMCCSSSSSLVQSILCQTNLNSNGTRHTTYFLAEPRDDGSLVGQST